MITNCRTIAWAASSIMMMGTVAQAADLYSPAPMPAYNGGWYFSVFGGANWLNDTSFDLAGPQAVVNEYSTGFVAGGAIGYDMGEAMGPFGLRLEAELSYRENDVDTHVVGGTPLPGNLSRGSTSALAGMGNILFDLNTNSPFTVYAGGGLGVANVDFDNHATTIVRMNDDDTVFAWQLIAGAGYEISQNMVLDVQYRYFNAGDISLTAVDVTPSSTDYESHSVLAGIRIKF